MSIAPLMFNAYLSPKTMRFSSRLYLDMGASGQSGSVKVRLEDDQGKHLKTISFAVKDNAKVQGTAEYLACIAGRIKAVYQQCQPQLPQADTLNSVTITTAGTPRVNGVVPLMENIKDTQGQFLKNIDYRKLRGLLTSKKIPVVKAEQFKLTVLNDMAGGAAKAFALVKHLVRQGSTWKYLMPGGGLGEAKMTRDTRNHVMRIELVEGGHNSLGPGKTWESHGISAQALVNNFAIAVRAIHGNTFDGALATIIESKNAAVATSWEAAQEVLGHQFTDMDFNQCATFVAQQALNTLAIAITNSVVNNQGGVVIAKTKVIEGLMRLIDRFQYRAEFNVQSQQVAEILKALPTTHYLQKHLPQSAFEKVLLATLWQHMDASARGKFTENNYKIKLLDISDNTKDAPFLYYGQAVSADNTQFEIPLTAYRARR